MACFELENCRMNGSKGFISMEQTLKFRTSIWMSNKESLFFLINTLDLKLEKGFDL